MAWRTRIFVVEVPTDWSKQSPTQRAPMCPIILPLASTKAPAAPEYNDYSDK